MVDKMVSVMTDEAADKLTLVIEDRHGYRDYVDMDSRQAARLCTLLSPQSDLIGKKLAAALELAAEHWSPVLSDEITDQVEEARELAQKAGYIG
ncbi:hypothetical protein ACJ41P_10525 [Azospirillum argentinense]|uniref:Uncharacterized protein n=2 Tax=Azospirillum argentinense TaxID=2970906 RepID=A0ABW8V5T8_9PROT